MSLGAKRGMMWAGVTDGHIATDTGESKDPYTPLTIALFSTKAEAEKYYERVVRIDVDKLLSLPSTNPQKE